MKVLLNEKKVVFDFGEDIVFAKGGAPDGGLQECPESEATHIWNREKNMAVMANVELSGITMIEVEEIPEEVKEYEYKYVDGEFVINVEYRREQITRELEEKDKIINRATEDLYKATETTPYASVAKVIEEKEALRAELAQLK